MTNVNVQLKLNIQAFWYWKLVKKSKLIKWHFQFSVQGFVLRHLAVLYMISTIKLTVNFNLLLCFFNYEWKINLTSGILIRPFVIDSINYTDLLEWWLNIKVCKVCLNGFASGQPQSFFDRQCAGVRAHHLAVTFRHTFTALLKEKVGRCHPCVLNGNILVQLLTNQFHITLNSTRTHKRLRCQIGD